MNLFEFKTAFNAGETGEITGLAWPYNAGPDRVGDLIEKGAFAVSAGQTNLPMLFAHDPAQVVGVWNAFEESELGLTVKGRLLIDDVPRAREVHALVRSGAITGLSIGFSTKSARPRAGGGRTISKLELVECSLVSVPMHPRARLTSSKHGAEAIAIVEALNRAQIALSRKD